MKKQAILPATCMYFGPKCGLPAVLAIESKISRKTAERTTSDQAFEEVANCRIVHEHFPTRFS